MKTLCFAACVVFATTDTRAVVFPGQSAIKIPQAEGSYVLSLPHDFSRVNEESLFELLTSTDRGVRMSASASLTERWKSQAMTADAGNSKEKEKEKEKGKDEALDGNMTKLLEILHEKNGEDDAIGATGVLAYTPPSRAHRTVIEKHLRTAITEAKSIWVKVYAAESLCDFFWLHGEAPDEETVKVIDKLLLELKNPDARYLLLWHMNFMGSDALPFKKTLETLSGSDNTRTAETAKSALQGMERKMDAKARKERVFLPTVN
jgi:hypothetical protein